MAQKISKKDLRDRFPKLFISHTTLFNQELNKFKVTIEITPFDSFDSEFDAINSAECIYSELKKHFNFSNI